MKNRAVYILNQTLEVDIIRDPLVMPRYAMFYKPEKRALPAGTAVVELYEEQDETSHYYGYRTAQGLEFQVQYPIMYPLATLCGDPNLTGAMLNMNTLQQLLWDRGLRFNEVYPSVHPFTVIRCPMCGGSDFTTEDLAGVACVKCWASFTVRNTTGDPGFVVDCDIDRYDAGAAKLVMPKTRNLSFYMVLKDTRSPHNMSTEDCYAPECTAGGVALTKDNNTLRDGLHKCMVGTLYTWQLQGRPHRECEVDLLWVRGTPNFTLYGEVNWLRNTAVPDELGEIGCIPEGLPDIFELKKNERYLLYGWVHHRSRTGTTFVYPLWHVVTAVVGERGTIQGWNLVRADIDPIGGTRVTRAIMAGDSWTVRLHKNKWQEMGWTPIYSTDDVGDEEE